MAGSLEKDPGGAGIDKANESAMLDMSFVAACLVIGTGNVLLVLLVQRIAGAPAATTAGAALTAFATWVFQKYERLRFQPLPDESLTTIRIAIPDWGRFLILVLAFMGIEGYFAFLIQLFFGNILGWNAPEYESLNEQLNSRFFWIATVSTRLLLHFLGGLASAVIRPDFRFSTVAIASVIHTMSWVLYFVIQHYLDVIKGHGSRMTSVYLSYLIFSIFYALSAVVGAWLARRVIRPKAAPKSPTG